MAEVLSRKIFERRGGGRGGGQGGWSGVNQGERGKVELFGNESTTVPRVVAKTFLNPTLSRWTSTRGQWWVHFLKDYNFAHCLKEGGRGLCNQTNCRCPVHRFKWQ